MKNFGSISDYYKVGTVNPSGLAENMSSMHAYPDSFVTEYNPQQDETIIPSNQAFGAASPDLGLTLQDNVNPNLAFGVVAISEPIQQGYQNSSFAFSATSPLMVTTATQELQYSTLYESTITEEIQFGTLTQQNNNNAIEEYNQIEQYNKYFDNVTLSNVTSTVVIITQTSDSGFFKWVKALFKEISTYKYQARELTIHENGLGPIVRYIYRKKTLL